MRVPTPVLLLLVTALAVSAAMAATPRPPDPMQGPGIGPMQQPPPGEHVDKYGDLAEKPYRPEWAPLPLLWADTAPVVYLHELIDSENADERARAAFLLGQIGCPDSLPLLAECLNDAERSVRVQAGIALACMGDARGKHTCAAVLSTHAEWIRYFAALGLSRLLGQDIDRPFITRALKGAMSGQSAMMTQTIDGAVKGAPLPPPVENLPDQAPTAPAPSPEQIWEGAADVFVAESDWWFHKGDYDQAIRCSEASIFLDPDYVETYTVVAWLEWSMGQNAQAVRTLNRAIAANPDDPESHAGLGAHYFNIKEYALAEEPLKKAVELGADHLIHRTYAHCLEALGKLRESLAEWERLLETRPSDGAIRLNRDQLKERLSE